MPIHNIYKDSSIYFRHLTDSNPDPSIFHMHIHDQFEVLYCVNGHVNCIVETTTYPLSPNSLIIMRHMESHKVNILNREPYERYTINFSSELLESIGPSQKLISPFVNRPLGEKNYFHISEFDVNIGKIFSAMETPATDDNERRMFILINFYYLLEQIFYAFTNKKQETFINSKPFITEVANYINANLFDDLSLELLAKKFFLSTSHLSHQFKQATGFSVWNYIINKRLAAARNLIQSGRPATHVYSECGFNDYSSFYRLYCKKFGASPKVKLL